MIFLMEEKLSESKYDYRFDCSSEPSRKYSIKKLKGVQNSA